mmetsp:Transcript_54698/g.162814  ORF Transcript_54698/g.162814 Transcript_54698/m.162814 type:complete len:209 (-) Transcript_54698:65-691(-)
MRGRGACGSCCGSSHGAAPREHGPRAAGLRHRRRSELSRPARPWPPCPATHGAGRPWVRPAAALRGLCSGVPRGRRPALWPLPRAPVAKRRPRGLALPRATAGAAEPGLGAHGGPPPGAWRAPAQARGLGLAAQAPFPGPRRPQRRPRGSDGPRARCRRCPAGPHPGSQPRCSTRPAGAGVRGRAREGQRLRGPRRRRQRRRAVGYGR